MGRKMDISLLCFAVFINLLFIVVEGERSHRRNVATSAVESREKTNDKTEVFVDEDPVTTTSRPGHIQHRVRIKVGQNAEKRYLHTGSQTKGKMNLVIVTAPAERESINEKREKRRKKKVVHEEEEVDNGEFDGRGIMGRGGRIAHRRKRQHD